MRVMKERCWVMTGGRIQIVCMGVDATRVSRTQFPHPADAHHYVPGVHIPGCAIQGL